MTDIRMCRVCQCTENDCSGCIERTGEPCHWVDEDLCSACESLAVPRTITPAIAELLGMPNFQSCPVAHIFQAAGFPIKKRVEDEQAFVLHRFLPLAILHGNNWRQFASADIDRQLGKAKALATEKARVPQS